MCGIFGVLNSKNGVLRSSIIPDLVKKMYVLSEARGKESSGIAVHNTQINKLAIMKDSLPASKFIKEQKFLKFFSESFDGLLNNEMADVPFSMIAHARLVTNGTQENNNNNQPVIKSDLVAVHNGIITNVNQLWKKYSHLDRKYEVDTEVFLSMIAEKASKTELTNAIKETYAEIEGTASVAIIDHSKCTVILSTNNGSLYYVISENQGTILFASEKHILRTTIEEMNLTSLFPIDTIQWMKPGNCIIFDYFNHNLQEFDFANEQYSHIKEESVSSECIPSSIINYSEDKPINIDLINDPSVYINTINPKKNLLEYNDKRIKVLNRCSKCILPETFPYIEFDDKGVCNYCNSYIVKSQGAREEEFKELMKTYRSKDGSPDCIIPFSGGRDSSYGLHYIVHELGMKPITYTYDWGMVTDLARRNIARVCGKLGVENIIVSADINKKRANIRKNVNAWLKSPQLGMIPLFMAGDKHFLYYVNQIKKQTGIKLDIWSTNILENTDFKVGFCGIRPIFDKTRPDYLPLKSKIGLSLYYLKNFITNPAYINSSLFDTMTSFYSYYAEPRNHFYQLFDWIKWDEKQIEQTLFTEYNWELSPDTVTSWRIGDGTAAFYNYVYYTVAGFSEFDTFRSNQIREGLITREQAMSVIYKENEPRFESMLWYFETIGVDFERAIKIVNQIPKLYK